MRLTPDVALVGSGVFGFDLSAPMDAHCYLIDGGDELALVDCGAGSIFGSADLLLSTIESDGFDASNITKILLTHQHFDHCGGAAELSARLNIPVYGSPLVASLLATEASAEEAISLARGAGFLPDDYRLQPVTVAPDLLENTTVRVGNLTATVIETPGHCDGHVSFLVSGGDRPTLIQGDVVFHGGKIFLQNIPDCSIQRYAESTFKLDALEFEAFLPGHGAISLTNGKRHVSAAAAQFAKLAVPQSLA
jgi:glyoxylase-like metal-dependent hydrolase (beta-lactamase superfamily II)